MTRQEQLAWVRRALLALGGWNARSRGVLRAWAASQRIGAAELESLVTQAVGAARRPPPPARSAPELPARRRRANARWWAAAGALAGMAVSASLVQQLIERWPRPAPPRPVQVEARPAPSESPSRTLPPVPVPFPAAPDVVASTGSVGQGPVLFAGSRPAGEASAGEVRAWGQALDSVLTSWPDRDPQSTDRALDELSAWLATSPSTRDLDRLQQVLAAAVKGHAEPSPRMLADAFAAMLLERAARSEALTSTAAQAFGGQASGPGALQTWATGQMPTLKSMLQRPDGRAPWAAWLRAVARLPQDRVRVQVTLQAIDAVLRSGARLDGQGLPADVAGSLLEGLPVEPSQAGFDLVREAWQAWLRDGSVDARSLWALGGVWRALPASPDPQLLPGERDGMRQREQVADAWQALPVTPALPAWQPLQARLAEIESGSPQDAAGWISRLADLMDLVRMLHASRRGRDPARIAPATPAEEPPPPEPVVPADRWKSRLAEASRAPRLMALEQIQANELTELGWGDAERVTALAIRGRDRQERERAIELLRGPMAATPSARRGLLLQAATVEDLRKAVEVLEIACERALPGADAASLRQEVLAALLALEPAGAAAASLRAPLARLRAACSLWTESEGLPAVEGDPAPALWSIALHRERQVNAVATPASFRGDLEGAADRVRRLHRVAGSGPRGVAAATLALVVWQSAWLAAERPDLAPALLDMLRTARGQAASVDQAVPQACVALGWIARMELARMAAPVPPLPVAADLPQASQWLLRAASSADPERARWLEQAWVAGGGAMLPEPQERRVSEALSLLQALAWCHQGQVELLARQVAQDPGRSLAERMAAAREQGLAAWGAWLTDLPETERWEALAPLRLAAAEALLPRQAAWPRAATEAAAGVPVP